MKKIITILLTLFFAVLFSVTALAEEDFMKQSIDSIIDSVDKETVRLLEDLGLDDYSFEELYNISISGVSDLIMSIFKGSLKQPLKCVITVIGLLLVSTIGQIYTNKSNNFSQFLEVITVIFLALLLLSEMLITIKRTVTSIESVGILMKILIPILAAIVTFSGNPSLATSYNAVTMYISQLITAVCRDFLTPVLIIFTCISACLSLNNIVKSDSILNMIKKFVTMILGFIGTVFTGIITIKDILATGVDKVSVKGIKFLIGSSVPVVGSVLSEGLSSVLASVSLMKNTLGVIGIIIIIVVVLPVVCELTVWIFSLAFSGYCCEVLCQSRAASVLSSFRFTCTFLLSVLLFTVYILIVSTGMIIIMGNK